jgi:hypothetical protein
MHRHSFEIMPILILLSMPPYNQVHMAELSLCTQLFGHDIIMKNYATR